MLRHSSSAVIARSEAWRGASASEPYEVGWAAEAVIFVQALKPPVGPMPQAHVEISPDGMRWLREGTQFSLPRAAEEVVWARVSHFGGWLRIAADLPEGAECVVLMTMHLK